jgi:hypothetical protein
MNLKKYQPLLEITLFSVLVYVLHKIFFFQEQGNPRLQNFHFTLELIYGFFLICSLIIILILLKIKKKNIDNVGYVFLLVTSIKLAISYTILFPIIHSGNINVNAEKINFFVIFALFLTIETVVTIRILNNKQ